MYTFYLGDNQESIKNSWEELNQEEYLFLVSLLEEFNSGILSPGEVRAKLAAKLLGIKKVRCKNADQEDKLYENLYHIQRHIGFVFKINYNDARYERLSTKTKRYIRHNEPDEYSSDPEIRIASNFAYAYEVDMIFCKNLIPYLKIGRKNIPGYVFEVKDGLLISNLKSLQWIDALTVCNEICRSGKSELFDWLLAILYYEGAYDSDNARTQADKFKGIDIVTKKAVFLNFQAIFSFILNRTKYKYLYRVDKEEKKGKKGSEFIGFADPLYTLEKSYKDIEKASVIKFFELQFKELADSIREMAGMDMKVDEIAQRLKLDINLVNQLL